MVKIVDTPKLFGYDNDAIGMYFCVFLSYYRTKIVKKKKIKENPRTRLSRGRNKMSFQESLAIQSTCLRSNLESYKD